MRDERLGIRDDVSRFAFLRFAFCLLRFAFCVLRLVCYVLRVAFCVLRFAVCVLRFAVCRCIEIALEIECHTHSFSDMLLKLTCQKHRNVEQELQAGRPRFGVKSLWGS